ncbi:P-loop NTPase family protein [Acidimangrovimonas sediminis]|uniref:hypothetical protein n=1 Tax=Acidimangrovimonas sediminis TaxID=2056283 RepID=UPI000C80A019|nr:hypothetical protein [Acidimangrovimonas sediminis]
MTRRPRSDRLGPRPEAGTAPRGLRKPRLLIAGEFSSGKTQLVTGLLGDAVLPSNVTSTALPPVWLVGGAGPCLAVGADGSPREVPGIDALDVETTRYSILAHRAPILETVEIIDTPGNSDPNIPAETWQRMVSYADAVIWCTNATQAWRQSEKSVWLEMPEGLRRSATLLITHADRMPDQRAADRVLRRVRREAEPFFSHFLVASLISAADVARIGAHVREVAGSLARRPGAENNVVATAATKAATSLPAGPQETTARPRPRPLRAQTAGTSTGISTDGTVAIGPGRARHLWQRLGGATASDDPSTILDRVDRLLEILDGPARDIPARETDDAPGNIFDDLSAPGAAPTAAARPSAGRARIRP